MSSFILLRCDGPEGLVQCPCGHVFDFDACTEDGFTQVKSKVTGKIVLALNCPSCNLVEVLIECIQCGNFKPCQCNNV